MYKFATAFATKSIHIVHEAELECISLTGKDGNVEWIYRGRKLSLHRAVQCCQKV